MIRALQLVVFVNHPLMAVPPGCGADKPSCAPTPALGAQATPHKREDKCREGESCDHNTGGDKSWVPKISYRSHTSSPLSYDLCTIQELPRAVKVARVRYSGE